jgi:hypothetical protein
VADADNVLEMGLPPEGKPVADVATLFLQEAMKRYGAMLRLYRYQVRPQLANCVATYCDLPGRGGVRMNYEYEGTWCTLGFLARGRGTGNLYAMTAGHCMVRSADGATHRQTVGARVCKTGATSGGTCGRITATGQTITFALDYDNVTINRLVQTTMCSRGGDSGGPVFVNGYAYGLAQSSARNSDGSEWRDAEGHCRSYYQGIKNAQDALNVDIVID